MAKAISTIETTVYEVTGTQGPRVLHDVAKFEILGTVCHVRTSPEEDLLFLRVGTRDFAVSLLDVAATATLAIEAHLKADIVERIRASRKAPAPSPLCSIPVRGVVEDDGFITLHSSRRG